MPLLEAKAPRLECATVEPSTNPFVDLRTNPFPALWNWDFVKEFGSLFVLPVDFLMGLWFYCLKAPVNPDTGDKRLIVVPVDSHFGMGTYSQICSLRASNLPKDSILYCCMDNEIYDDVTGMGVNAILYRNCNLTYRNRHRLKLVLCNLVLRAGLEAYILDSDIFFFDDFSKLWRYETDVEFMSDDNLIAETRFLADHARLNSGLIRYAARLITRQFLDEVLRACQKKQNDRHKDQAMLRLFARDQARRKSALVWTLVINGKTMTFSYIEPWRGCTGGVLFCLGKKTMCDFVEQNKIDKPVAVHVNYHWPMIAKARTMRILNLTVDKNHCRDLEWPFWQPCKFPINLKCIGHQVEDIDEWSLSSYGAYI
jgi:hypothetical protein